MEMKKYTIRVARDAWRYLDDGGLGATAIRSATTTTYLSGTRRLKVSVDEDSWGERRVTRSFLEDQVHDTWPPEGEGHWVFGGSVSPIQVTLEVEGDRTFAQKLEGARQRRRRAIGAAETQFQATLQGLGIPVED